MSGVTASEPLSLLSRFCAFICVSLPLPWELGWLKLWVYLQAEAGGVEWAGEQMAQVPREASGLGTGYLRKAASVFSLESEGKSAWEVLDVERKRSENLISFIWWRKRWLLGEGWSKAKGVGWPGRGGIATVVHVLGALALDCASVFTWRGVLFMGWSAWVLGHI